MSRQESITQVATMRDLAKAALRSESLEAAASRREHADWDAYNDDKWSAFQDAADAIPGGQAALDKGEDSFLGWLRDIADATDHALVRRFGLPW